MANKPKKKVKAKTQVKKHVKKVREKTPAKRKISRGESLESVRKTKIRIIGIGGGGGSIVAGLVKSVGRADFVAANTDLQAQKNLPQNVRRFVFGQELTHGLGCGMDDKLGEAAAKAEKDKIKKLMEGQDVCILIVSLGGGAGSGAVSVFAEAAKDAKCLSIGIFTMPFSFEGQKRQEIAQAALEKTVPLLNAYVLIPNENIFRVIDQKTPLRGAFSAVNKKLAETLEGFIDTLALPGFINIDFADFKTLLEGRGRLAYLNSAVMQGAPKARLALKEVLHNPLYDYGITGADRILFNLTGDKGMKMQEVAEISKSIFSFNTKARIIFGISFQPEYKDKLRIALFAIGCKKPEALRQAQGKEEKTLVKPAQKRKVTQKKSAGRKQKERVKVASSETRRGDGKNSSPAPKISRPRSGKVRRNALDLKKAKDQELKDLEKQEHQWDIPSFLRNTRYQEDSP